MLIIRLQRAGKKNKPEYRIILAQKTAAAQKKFLEVLGNYNPHTKAFNVKDEARLKYWIEEQHVEVSPTVHNLLVSKNLVSDKKVKAFTLPKKEVEETPAEEVQKEEPTPTSEPVSEEGGAETATESTNEEVQSEAPAEEPASDPEEVKPE